MNPLLSLSHLPVILFLSGALVLGLGDTAIPERIKKVIALVICGCVGALLVVMKASLPLDVVFSDWLVGLTLFGSLVYQVNMLSWAFAVCSVILVAAIIISFSESAQSSQNTRLFPGLFLLSAATFSILFSGNLLTLMCSWALLVAAAVALEALASVPGSSVCRLLIIWGAGTFALLGAVWNVGWGDGGRWVTFVRSQPAALAVFLVAWIALATYPAHLWLPHRHPNAGGLLTIFHTLPVLTGLYLLTRLSLLQVALPFQGLWIGLGCLALLIGAQLAWSQPDRARSLSYLGVALSGGVILTVALLLPQSIEAMLIWTLFLPFSLLVLFTVPPRADGAAPRWHNWLLRLVTALAGASVVGLPPTAGFIAWGQLHNAGLTVGSSLVMAVLLIALILSNILISAVFFRVWLISPAELRTHRVFVTGIVALILVVPGLVGMLVPAFPVEPLIGPEWREWSLQAYSSMTIGVWAIIVLSVATGYVLNLWPPATAVVAQDPIWRVVVRVWSLDWVCAAVGMIGRRLSGVMDMITDMLNGDHYLLWALLVLLLFLWLYLFS